MYLLRLYNAQNTIYCLLITEGVIFAKILEFIIIINRILFRRFAFIIIIIFLPLDIAS